MWNTFQSKYQIVKKIGEGSFSEVLECEERMTGTHVAAKRLKKIYKSRDEMVTCAELIASEKVQRHPNVLSLKEYFFDTFGGKIIFIFELMDMSMYDLIKMRTSKRMTESRVKRYLFQILRGLDHLHRNGLFHRDIKPENILVKFQSLPEPLGPELIKIADLGSVRGTYSSPPYTEYISTRWYRSPECLLTVGFYGPKMDIWATGCVFYEMVTLQPIFAGKNEVDQLHKIHAILGVPGIHILKKLKNKSQNYMKFEPVKPKGIESITPDFSSAARHILKMMLQYDPDKRINVGRLINNDYFDIFRKPSMHAKPAIAIHHKNPADGWNTCKQRSMSGSNYSGEPAIGTKDSKESKGSKKSVEHSINRLSAEKPTLDIINYCNTHKNANYKLRENNKPLVDVKSLKSWGVNPNILRAIDPNDKRNHSHRVKPEQNRVNQRKLTRLVASDSFRKTTSDLPQYTKQLLHPKDIKQTEFHSQSLIVPWYAGCPHKVDKPSNIYLENVRRCQIKRRLIKGT